MEKSRRGTDAVGTARLATRERTPIRHSSHGGAELEALKTNGA